MKKIKVYQDAKGEYRWTYIAANGRKRADSAEGYKTRRKCVDAVRDVFDTHTTHDAALTFLDLEEESRR